MEVMRQPQTQSQCLFSATIGVDYHPSQKNSKKIFLNKRTGQRFIGSTSRVKSAKEVLLQYLQSRAREYGLTEPIKHRVYCVLLFGFPEAQFYTKRLTENRNNGDCTNLAQAVEDCLQKAGVIENDFLLAPVYIDRVVAPETQVQIELYADSK